MTDEEAEAAKQQMIDVVASIHNRLVELTPSTQEGMSDPEVLVAVLHAGCLSLYQGIYRLMPDWLTEEAWILCRTLMVDSITLLYFMGYADKLEEMFLKFQVSSYRHEIALEREALTLGLEGAGDKVALREAELPALESHGKALGWTTLKGLPGFKDMLVEAEKAERYWSYRRASQAVHTSRLAMAGRVSWGDGRYDLGTKKDPLNLAAVTLLATDSVLIAHQSAALVLGWSSESDLNALAEELRGQLVEAAKAAGLDVEKAHLMDEV